MAGAFSNSTESIAPPCEDAMHELASVQANSCAFLLEADSVVLTGNRLLTFEAMHLLISLDRDLREARAQWNQDWFRRLMRIRPKAVSRLRRRWAKLEPPPAIPLGLLRRRYHANLARHLYQPADNEALGQRSKRELQRGT
jgi:hypothetical protein